MINIQNDQTFPINLSVIEQDAQTILNELGYADFDLGIELTDLEGIQFFNKTYRQKDQPTDILSFPFHPELKAGERIEVLSEDDQNLGDLILCPQYIKNDLVRWDYGFEERVRVLLVHGICHLLGYDHIEDADYEIMHKLELKLLDKLKQSN